MSTASNRTPNQLWIQGMLHTPNQLWIQRMLHNGGRLDEFVVHHVYITYWYELLCVQDDPLMYGVDWNAPLPEISNKVNGVAVPDIPCPLSEEYVVELSAHYSLQTIIASDCHAVDVHVDVLNFVQTRVNLQ